MPASRNLNLRAASSVDPGPYSPISLVAISRTLRGLEEDRKLRQFDGREP